MNSPLLVEDPVLAGQRGINSNDRGTILLEMDFPVLDRSYKNRYPFRLATTSFVYPAGYARNVQILAPFVDEIELLLFESHSAQCLPAPAEIRQLQHLADEHDLSYSVHLPIDIQPGSADPGQRRRAVAAVQRVLSLTADLNPRSYILHLPGPGSSKAADDLAAWQNWNRESLAEMFPDPVPSDRICIENLDYPMGWYEPLVEASGMKLCLDIGHLVCQSITPAPILQRLREAISVLHLHGVENGRDHLPLGPNNQSPIQPLLGHLQNFHGSVCIEVFDYGHLQDSLRYFDRQWAKATHLSPAGGAPSSGRIAASDCD